MAEFRPMVEDDVEEVVVMREAAFGLPRQPDDVPAELDGEYHVIAEGRRVLAVLRVHRWSQWFGGRAVTTAGIGSVTVAADARGRGTGQQLMARTLAMLRGEGVALSTLFPSTSAPYRRVGYELAGERVRFSLALGHLPPKFAGDVEPWDDDDLDAVRACYRRFAEATNGMLDRSEGAWRNAVLAPSGDRRVFRYLVREDGDVSGYVVYTQEAATGRMPFRFVPGDTPYNYRLACRDLVAVTGEAARRLLGFLAAHRAMASEVLWTGASNDPLDGLLPAAYGLPQARALWMVRVVDVVAALEARGYPLGVETTVEFTVLDETLADNASAYRLEVSAGTSKVTQIDGAEASIEVGALASLYTGWHRPHDLVRVGALRGASAATVAACQTIFAGPSPWMLDMF